MAETRFDLNDIHNEPSDEALAALMEAVAKEARRRGALACEQMLLTCGRRSGMLIDRPLRLMADTQPRLIVVAGPNGSGKTSITEQLLRHTWMDGCEYVNPDNIARDVFGDWNAPEAVLAAAQKAAEIRTKCLTEHRSLAFETVLSAPDKIKFIRHAKASG